MPPQERRLDPLQGGHLEGKGASPEDPAGEEVDLDRPVPVGVDDREEARAHGDRETDLFAKLAPEAFPERFAPLTPTPGEFPITRQVAPGPPAGDEDPPSGDDHPRGHDDARPPNRPATP